MELKLYDTPLVKYLGSFTFDYIIKDYMEEKISKILKRKKIIKKDLKLTYTFWIEYRVNENRYWYGEYIPVFDPDTKKFKYVSNFIMTKNGLKKSMDILNDIILRINKIHEDDNIYCHISKTNNIIISDNEDPNWLTFSLQEIDSMTQEHLDNKKNLKKELQEKSIFLK